MALIEERIPVNDEADVFRARRLGREMACALGFDGEETAKIVIAITELSTNLIKHAARGAILLSPIRGTDGGLQGMTVASEDDGPGMCNLDAAVKDGFSTVAGSLGIGLSGVRRLMDEFSVESSRGTKVVTRKWLPSEPFRRKSFSVFTRPKPGGESSYSGDAYFIKHAARHVTFGIVDALGHGREAYDASVKALEVIEACHMEPLEQIVDACHGGLRGTRGAALSVCRIDYSRKRLRHIGIGNVMTVVFGSPSPIRPFSFNGTIGMAGMAGMAMEKPYAADYPYSDGLTIIMFSDGISERIEIDRTMLLRSPQEIALFVFNNYAKLTDDATVIVGR